ncbi:hypothetical protein BG011_008768 [Mortierella polycephala]|uniref:Uncharacterized protein n=1 Tax=Mortierella polycephala TaxID=41804 RepID=A0A9P6U8A6_9FUNG|nr:hypothetical protein BG011_008768 [Mortierella polycephala]
MPYTPNVLTRYTTSQLSVEFKRMYRKGNMELHEKPQTQKAKGLLPAACEIEIQNGVSLIENFSNALKAKLQELIGDQNYALADAQGWLSLQEPGFLVARLLTDMGRGEEHQRRKPGACKSFITAVRTLSTDEIQDHLEFIRQPTFDPSTYNSKGYILRGSLQTDGFRLQLLAFKLKEPRRILQSGCEAEGRLPASVQMPVMAGGAQTHGPTWRDGIQQRH